MDISLEARFNNEFIYGRLLHTTADKKSLFKLETVDLHCLPLVVGPGLVFPTCSGHGSILKKF